jgi:hypothetical protein
MSVIVGKRYSSCGIFARPRTGILDFYCAYHDQNRKYRWAMGSSSAGSQVNSSPSALTS